MEKTKNGFKNFWHYNKGKVIAVVALAVIIVLSAVQCGNRTEFDLSVLYVCEDKGKTGDVLLPMLASSDEVKQSCGKDNPKLNFKAIYISPDEAERMEDRVHEQLQVEFASGECNLYFIDKETMYTYKDLDGFYDLTDYADKYSVAEEDRYLTSDGKVCGISVAENSALASCGLGGEGMYMAIRNHTDKTDNEYQIAYGALEYILLNK